MKQMLEATHFIELCKDGATLFYSSIFKIEQLQQMLNVSYNLELKTIAIWKIKYK